MASEDVVTESWLARHGIRIPRAPGVHESETGRIVVNAHGIIIHAEEKDGSILGRLIANSKLEAWHGDNAKTYLDWKAAFSAYVEGARYHHEGRGSPKPWTKEDRYQKLNRRENRKRMDIIAVSCFFHPREWEMERALANPHVIRDAFDWLDRAIHSINKQAAESSRHQADNACTSMDHMIA